MTGLLVSVRSAEEAKLAMAGGADVIDVKEPANGPLGAASGSVWQEVSEIVAGACPVSVALGELTDAPVGAAVADLSAAGVRVDFAKMGLSGCGSMPDWHSRWTELLQQFPRHTAPVAVAYLDWRQSNSPSPRDIAIAATEFGCGALLLDTFDKNLGSVRDYLADEAVMECIALTKTASLPLAIAGSVSESSLEVVLPLEPWLVAVRGVVCDGKRTDAVSQHLVERFATAIREKNATAMK